MDSIGNLKKFYSQQFDEVDSALDKLGMLSTIARSHIDFIPNKKQKYILNENMSPTSVARPSPPLCVVHMNSDFVTQLSLTKNSTSVEDCNLPVESSAKTDLVFKHKGPRIRSRHFYEPYRYLKRKIRKASESGYVKPEVENLIDDRASPPIIISRQDSGGNKSNPSSPVKGQNSMTSLGCSIFRSRSLDDLEISKLNLNESCCDLASQYGEIDTVSQRISKLHVS